LLKRNEIHFFFRNRGEKFIFDRWYKIPDIFSRKILSVLTEKFLRSSYSGCPIDSFCKNEGRNVTARCTDVASLRENSLRLRHAEKMSEKGRSKKVGEGRGNEYRRLHTRRLIQTSEGADTHCDHMFST